jgi:hypothetical protein
VTVSGLTFDTGVLIALERRAQRAWNVYREAMQRKVPITVPTAVLVEWWRGRTDARERIRSGLRLEWLSVSLAEIAGEALPGRAMQRRWTRSSWRRPRPAANVVYTSDVDDLERLRAYFPAVRVLAV